MADATGSTDSKSTSPHNLPSAFLWIPTSMTTAPSLTYSLSIIQGFPIATIKMSARFVTSFRSAVRLWHTVTVAFSLSIKRAIGFPTILLRPTMTHSFPSISTPLRFKSCTIPAGVQDTKPGWPMLRAPTLCGWKPSTSFFGEMRFITASSSI